MEAFWAEDRNGVIRTAAKISTISRMLCVTVVLFSAAPMFGQRVRFPSSLGTSDPYLGAPATNPGYSQPRAVLDGSIYPPGVEWDPYGDPFNPGGVTVPPATTAPAPLDPNYYPPGTTGYTYGTPYPGPAYGPGADAGLPSQRFFRDINFRYTWLAGNGGSEFDNNDLEIFGSFAFPFWYNQEPLLLTPGFAVHYWEGPQGDNTLATPDLPPRVFDAYLDTGWQPRLTERLSMDLGVLVGVFSDFQEVNTDSIRIRGRGLVLYSFTPSVQAVAGVVYIDRNNIKLLPAGGIIWTPNHDVRYEIFFPSPKLAHRFTTIGNTEWWWYVAGEYGGGAWTIERANGAADNVDYSDLRLILGLEWQGIRRLTGFFEVGYVFARKVDYVSGTPDFKPNDTVMLRAGLSY